MSHGADSWRAHGMLVSPRCLVPLCVSPLLELSIAVEARRDGGLKGKQNRHAHRKHGARDNQASRNHAPKCPHTHRGSSSPVWLIMRLVGVGNARQVMGACEWKRLMSGCTIRCRCTCTAHLIRVVHDALRVHVVDGDLLVGKSRSELLPLVDSGRRQAAHCCRHHDDMAICS